MHIFKYWFAIAVLRREIRSANEGFKIWRQPDVHRPASAPGSRPNEGHVDIVDVRTFSRLAKPQTGHTSTDSRTSSLIDNLVVNSGRIPRVRSRFGQCSGAGLIRVERNVSSFLLEIHLGVSDARHFLQRVLNYDWTKRTGHILYIESDGF